MNEWQGIAQILTDPATAGVIGGTAAALLVQVWKRFVGLQQGEAMLEKRIGAFLASAVVTLAGYALANRGWSGAGFAEALLIAWLTAGGVHANVIKTRA